MSNDFTSNLVLNLQQRVSSLENTIGFLIGDVQRLTQNLPQQGFQTAIPLQPSQPVRRPYVARPTTIARPSVTPPTSDVALPPMALSEILHQGEVVTFGIHTGRDDSGSVTTTFLKSTFDGTNLTVSESSSVPSLVGTSSSKPGEILFKFMHGLVDAGLLQRTFNALPWRLATVQRDGQRITLAQLRREKQGLSSE